MLSAQIPNSQGLNDLPLLKASCRPVGLGKVWRPEKVECSAWNARDGPAGTAQKECYRQLICLEADDFDDVKKKRGA